MSKQKEDTKATIYYHDIGDYLSREEKLSLVAKYGSFTHLPMQTLAPNEHGDWLSLRNDNFGSFIPLAPEKKFDVLSNSFFNTYAIGVSTNRDAWVLNFSKSEVERNITAMIGFYNSQVEKFSEAKALKSNIIVDDVIDVTPSKISWTVNLKKDLEKNREHKFNNTAFTLGQYRPFNKQHLYFDKPFIERPGLNAKFFPNEKLKNVAISVTGEGNLGFSLLIGNSIIDLCFTKTGNGGGQIFPLYYYEEPATSQKGLFDDPNQTEYVRRDAISDFIFKQAQKQYGTNVTKKDIFFYVYGFLHSPDYRTTFANDLKKMLPRLPLIEDVKDFWKFSKAGRQLAELHLNYETIPPYEGVIINGQSPLFFGEGLGGEVFKVEKMRFPKKDQKDTIIYNSAITISNIPAQAYEYVVNGKSAIEWIMERYQVTINKDSGIRNDPNDWSAEVGNPRYILDLLLSIINVSLQTVGIVNGLPKVQF